MAKKVLAPSGIALSDDGADKLQASVRKLVRKPKAKVPEPKGPGVKKRKGAKKRKWHGGPKKGSLPPIAARVWRNPQATFETVKQADGVYGLVTGHMGKRFRLQDVRRVVQALSVKKELNLRRWKTVDVFARRTIRVMLRAKVIRVVKKG